VVSQDNLAVKQPYVTMVGGNIEITFPWLSAANALALLRHESLTRSVFLMLGLEWLICYRNPVCCLLLPCFKHHIFVLIYSIWISCIERVNSVSCLRTVAKSFLAFYPF
jgi:hypothetical protein